MKQLYTRHFDVCRELLPAARQEAALAGALANHRIFAHRKGNDDVGGASLPRSIDEAIAIGERLSAFLLAEYLESEGIRAAAVNAADVIATDAVFGNATPIMDETQKRAANTLQVLLDQRFCR